jgi:hypothetical protein
VVLEVAVGMAPGTSFFHRLRYVARCQMSIAHGHLNRLVARQFLHGSEVDACHRQAGDERVARVVPVEMRDARILHRFLEPGKWYSLVSAKVV